MLSHQLGFKSSWQMLTRDKGWVKPLLVLTIVGWIPILGQIALLGYALEWARLTAWGVDSAPKQSGVKYGKVLHTGWIALLVGVSMAIVCAIIDAVLFNGAYVAALFPATSGFAADVRAVFYGSVSLGAWLLMLVVNLLMGTFISVAMMRATIYDSFTAGWRLDRIFQMIGRDVTGFFKVYLVSLIAGLVNWIYSTVVSMIGLLVLLGGAVGFAYMAPTLDNAADYGRVIAFMLQQLRPATVLLLVLAAIALAFAGGVLGVAMQLVSINAVGQWFCRFEVGRWGVSADPLPENVPVTFKDDAPASAPAAGTQPVKPAEAENAAPAEAAAIPQRHPEQNAEDPAAPQCHPERSAEGAESKDPTTPVPEATAAPQRHPERSAEDPAAPQPQPAHPAEGTGVPAHHPECSAEATAAPQCHPERSAEGAESKDPTAPSADPAASESPVQPANDDAPAAAADKPEKDDHGPWDEVLNPKASEPVQHDDPAGQPAADQSAPEAAGEQAAPATGAIPMPPVSDDAAGSEDQK